MLWLKAVVTTAGHVVLRNTCPKHNLAPQPRQAAAAEVSPNCVWREVARKGEKLSS